MPKSYDSATVELAMTLSTLAYVDEHRTATQQQMIGEINAGLEEAGYPTWAGRRTESDLCGLTGARDWLARRRGRQERLDCSQQLVNVYRLRDIGSASTLQSLGFVSWRRKRGHCDDRNGLGLIVLFEQAGHLEPADRRQSYIHQDQIRLFIASEVDRFQPLGSFQYSVPVGIQKVAQQRHTQPVVLDDQDSLTPALSWRSGVFVPSAASPYSDLLMATRGKIPAGKFN
jgi:hypothetical protein